MTETYDEILKGYQSSIAPLKNEGSQNNELIKIRVSKANSQRVLKPCILNFNRIKFKNNPKMILRKSLYTHARTYSVVNSQANIPKIFNTKTKSYIKLCDDNKKIHRSVEKETIKRNGVHNWNRMSFREKLQTINEKELIKRKKVLRQKYIINHPIVNMLEKTHNNPLLCELLMKNVKFIRNTEKLYSCKSLRPAISIKEKKTFINNLIHK